MNSKDRAEGMSFKRMQRDNKSLFRKGRRRYCKVTHTPIWGEYKYKANVIRFYDADTMTEVDLDMGMGITKKAYVRLRRINAWEVRGEQAEKGKIARDAVIALIANKEIMIETFIDKKGRTKKGKYGRYLGEIWVKQMDGSLLNLNDWIVENGHGIYQTY